MAVPSAGADEPLTSLRELAAAGREPRLPARLATVFGDLILERTLRLLPGRRLTARARLAGEPVIAKLFFADRKARREAAREAARLARLEALAVPAPRLLGDSGGTEQGRVLTLQCLPGESALAVYAHAYPRGQGESVVTRLVAFVAELHRQGCVQSDAHLGNFLIDGSCLYLVDAGSVLIRRRLSAAAKRDNLAALLAQFYPLDCLDLNAIRHAYGPDAPTLDALAAALARARTRRYRHALKKIHRECSDYAVVRAAGLAGMASRSLEEDFQALMAAGIDRQMAEGETLKPGNSSTVSRVRWRGHDWVIKRYNTKSPGHRLRKQFKPSRASRSWRNARWLELIGLATPAPVGYAERRPFGVLDTAYFVCQYVAGPSLAELPAGPDLTAAQQQMERVFDLMKVLNFNHGDLKATNFLWVAQRLCVLDLDAMRLELPAGEVETLVERDRARWRRNFTKEA
ncbi:lipopolysaccharide kinase InaA family protein [Alloalcanivorax mobilis]|uniref:lipopolysaccharide kinase InaA family protein n=1 Tax=Alloalcanivorax mobilis TaxID=2019569 RepID=UPI000B5B2A7A|nr:lipopolysaccharide kinase InaA family protein [Alloalcanivorax mobilis]ASK35495.1 hypothetical protein CEK62_14475 [Alcanivorax sp. N3-2A]|tara:strand:- start:16 stop:1392 length:1377 start_codon:yes stop_codon:yes gene_type:complete